MNEKLNKENKFSVNVGDVLRVGAGDEYVVVNVFRYYNRNALAYTLQNTKTKQTFYGYPSSCCYGAEIIKGGH